MSDLSLIKKNKNYILFVYFLFTYLESAWSVAVVVFQSTFHLEMYQNNIFLKKYILKLVDDLKISKKINLKKKLIF